MNTDPKTCHGLWRSSYVPPLVRVMVWLTFIVFMFISVSALTAAVLQAVSGPCEIYTPAALLPSLLTSLCAPVWRVFYNFNIATLWLFTFNQRRKVYVREQHGLKEWPQPWSLLSDTPTFCICSGKIQLPFGKSNCLLQERNAHLLIYVSGQMPFYKHAFLNKYLTLCLEKKKKCREHLVQLPIQTPPGKNPFGARSTRFQKACFTLYWSTSLPLNVLLFLFLC